MYSDEEIRRMFPLEQMIPFKKLDKLGVGKKIPRKARYIFDNMSLLDSERNSLYNDYISKALGQDVTNCCSKRIYNTRIDNIPHMVQLQQQQPQQIKQQPTTAPAPAPSAPAPSASAPSASAPAPAPSAPAPAPPVDFAQAKQINKFLFDNVVEDFKKHYSKITSEKEKKVLIKSILTVIDNNKHRDLDGLKNNLNQVLYKNKNNQRRDEFVYIDLISNTHRVFENTTDLDLHTKMTDWYIGAVSKNP